MAGANATREREGLSLQTLVIAAVASGVAAVLVSRLWKDGTVLAAAMTPVIVSVVKEMLHRPMQSDAVRRAASTVSDVATARRAVRGTAAARTESARRLSPTTTAPRPPSNGDGEVTPGDVLLTHPRRTYGSGSTRRLRRPHLKVAIVTGLLAFLVAAVVITVPELVFGGAVGSKHRTTLFGGGAKSSESRDNSKDQDQGDQPQARPQQPDGGGNRSEPAPDQSQQQPAQPSEPSQPQQPPSGGGAPSAPSAPSPATP